MFRIWLFLLLFITIAPSYAQTDSVIRYANGRPQYVLTYDNGSLEKNTYLSPNGDTIYKWDIAKAEITEYPITGDYLLRKEYAPLRKQLSKINAERIENLPQINTNAPASISSREWGAMYSIFFSNCRDYTEVIKEGPFTIITTYKGHIHSGAFQKFYNGRLVVSGQYLEGEKHGIWQHYPYSFYPYRDVTFFGYYLNREWSFFYSVLPLALSVILLIVAGSYMREEKYQYFFYSVMGCALITLLLRLCIPFDRENVWIRFTIPALWFTFWQAMTILATVNLFFSGKKTNTHPLLNVFCLLVGLLFSVFVIFFKHLNF